MSKETKQYFMYGILIQYSTFLDSNNHETLEEILNEEDEIQGIFTGRNGDFIIIGKVLKTIDNGDEPQLVPELNEIETKMVSFIIKKRYRLEGEFNYYFVKKQ